MHSLISLYAYIRNFKKIRQTVQEELYKHTFYRKENNKEHNSALKTPRKEKRKKYVSNLVLCCIYGQNFNQIATSLMLCGWTDNQIDGWKDNVKTVYST